ncbi:MAG: hypothetical protein QGH60_22280 [Phycisphaerae bacterium]|jgi:hypothetical protein|nr:hypothetical protein [Phycisphaerae bacterium]
MNKKTCIILLLIVGVLACRAESDEVKIGGLSYRNVAVTGEQNGNIVFVFRGNKISKPLAQVSRIHLSTNSFFNTGESLRNGGKFSEAAKAYKRALTRAPQALKGLIATRIALAESFQSGATAVKRTTAPLKGKCPHCRSTGLMACLDCKSSGHSNCTECLGRKRVACPTCSGNWGRKCPECLGKKEIQIGKKREGSGGIFVRPIFEACKRCDRTGFVCSIKLGGVGGTAWISRAGLCPTCGNNDINHRGKMPCAKCKGVGRAGSCPRCKGTRKTICTFCVKVSKTDPSKTATAGTGAAGTSPAGAWRFKPGPAALAKKKYDANANNAQIEYQRRLKDLKAKLGFTLKDIRQALIIELDAAIKEAAAKGDLDEAVKIRDAKISATKGLTIPVSPPTVN